MAGDEFLDRAALLKGRSRRRQPSMLYLLESWSDLSSDNVVEFLSGTDAFAGMPVDALSDLRPYLEPVHVSAGDVVMRAGEAGDALYIVGYGRLQVYRQIDDREWVIAEIGPGQVAGEAALLIDAPRSASVRAARDSLLLRLSRSGLESFAGDHPDVPFRLARQLLKRMVVHESPAAGGEPGLRTVAIVQAGSLRIPPEFLDALSRAMGGPDEMLHLSSASLDQELGPGSSEIGVDDPRNVTVVEWLQRMERTHPLVLYEADPAPTTWTRRCLRQADRVLLVAVAGGDPSGGEIERALLAPETAETRARRELVLLHRQGTSRPSHTAEWLRGRRTSAHHHVRLGEGEHYRRLARFVTGRAVGLVFGGGGARGAAHLGVVRALEESGVPIDAVGGTSIGAVAAAMCALGWDHATRMRKVPKLFSTRVVIQPTLPIVSLSSGRRAHRVLVEESAGAAIEDLWIGYFSMSTNLSRAIPVIHDHGKLSYAVRASLSLPGILPPVRHGSDLLVDGGLLNNLPIDVMQARLGGGRVIAVDLRKRVEFRMRSAVGPVLTGWEVLGRRLFGGRKALDVPGLGSILQRTIELSGLLSERDVMARQGTDLTLRPPVERYGLFDFKAAPQLIDEAYRYTLDQLAGFNSEKWSLDSANGP